MHFMHAKPPRRGLNCAPCHLCTVQETNKDIDFYLVPEPKWLDAKYPKEAKMVKRPCVALVSSDEYWIT